MLETRDSRFQLENQYWKWIQSQLSPPVMPSILDFLSRTRPYLIDWSKSSVLLPADEKKSSPLSSLTQPATQLFFRVQQKMTYSKNLHILAQYSTVQHTDLCFNSPYLGPLIQRSCSVCSLCLQFMPTLHSIPLVSTYAARTHTLAWVGHFLLAPANNRTLDT